MTEKKKLGEIFIDERIIDHAQLKAALDRQKKWGGRFGSHLVKLGFVSELTLLKFLCNQHECPGADLSKTKFKKDVLSLIPKNVAKMNFVIPLDIREIKKKKVLFMAMSEPSITTINDLNLSTGIEIKPVIATESQILSAIEKYYDGKNWLPIEPLSGELFDEKDAPIIHGFPQNNIIEEINLKDESITNDQIPDILALINLLIKKGVFEWEEYMSELLKVKE